MPNRRRDQGFTLIELLVTISLLGVIMAIAVSGWASWARSSEQSGTAREIQSLLRQTQQRAVTEGRSMCVLFDTSTNRYTVFRGSCDAADKSRIQGPSGTGSSTVHLAAPAFLAPSGTNSQGVTFTARGTAWPGAVHVTRTSATKVYVLKVEGLTGRVSLS